MTEEDLIEKLAMYLATERSKVGVYPASQIARQVISMVRERDRQKRALDDLIAGDADLYDLSAAPSPDGEEVERVSAVILNAAVLDLRSERLTDSEIAVTPIITNPIDVARAAIAVMRPKQHHAIGKWLSAALEDPSTCEEMKADIRAWFDAGEPSPVRPTSPEPPE